MTGKRRRTAEQSRSIILEVAARRLHEYGLDGLNIKGVAEEAGLSHATLIHHFGSSGGMRDALAEMMTVQLVDDLVAAFAAHTPPEQMTANLFKAFADGGHSRLIAWRAVAGSPGVNSLEHLSGGVQRLLEMTRELVGSEREADAKRMILLVAVAAVGFGLAGKGLAQLLHLDADEIEDFPAWVTQHLT